MTKNFARVPAVLVALVVGGALGAGGAAVADEHGTSANAVSEIDPQAFFGRLIERYRRLETYRDTVDVVYVTAAVGREPHRVVSRISCRIAEGRLRVQTAGSQVRDSIGLDVPIKRSPAMEALVLRYNLWLAPHMTLRFAEDPRKEFRLGVDEGFTPDSARLVTIAGRQKIHLHLRSAGGPGEQVTAAFDLIVDPNTMLIERIDGEQRLPDGTNYRTSLRITPLEATGKRS